MKRNLIIAICVVFAACFLVACPPPLPCDDPESVVCICDIIEHPPGTPNPYYTPESSDCIGRGCGEKITINFDLPCAALCIDFEIAEGWDEVTAAAYVQEMGGTNNLVISSDGCQAVFSPYLIAAVTRLLKVNPVRDCISTCMVPMRKALLSLIY